jgi:hypothetical protein
VVVGHIRTRGEIGKSGAALGLVAGIDDGCGPGNPELGQETPSPTKAHVKPGTDGGSGARRAEGVGADGSDTGGGELAMIGGELQMWKWPQ